MDIYRYIYISVCLYTHVYMYIYIHTHTHLVTAGHLQGLTRTFHYHARTFPYHAPPFTGILHTALGSAVAHSS